MTIRGGYWIIVEIHFEKPKMPDCTVQSGPIYGLSALQYKQHFSQEISRIHTRELGTQGTASGVSVIPRFITRGHNNNCDVMHHQGDVS